MRLDVFLSPSALTPAALDGRILAVPDALQTRTHFTRVWRSGFSTGAGVRRGAIGAATDRGV